MSTLSVHQGRRELSLAELDDVQGGFWPLFLGAFAIGATLGVACGERNNEADEDERKEQR